jgi:hypothetical protein
MTSLIGGEPLLIGIVALLIEEEETSQIKVDSSFIEDAASLTKEAASLSGEAALVNN